MKKLKVGDIVKVSEYKGGKAIHAEEAAAKKPAPEPEAP